MENIILEKDQILHLKEIGVIDKNSINTLDLNDVLEMLPISIDKFNCFKNKWYLTTQKTVLKNIDDGESSPEFVWAFGYSQYNYDADITEKVIIQFKNKYILQSAYLLLCWLYENKIIDTVYGKKKYNLDGFIYGGRYYLPGTAVLAALIEFSDKDELEISRVDLKNIYDKMETIEPLIEIDFCDNELDRMCKKYYYFFKREKDKIYIHGAKSNFMKEIISEFKHNGVFNVVKDAIK